jgi:hypothetical protein
MVLSLGFVERMLKGNTPMKITAPADRAVTVVIFEPRQSEDQEVVELKRFDLAAGEEWDEDIRSATAAYRLDPQGLETRPAGYGQPAPDQEPRYGLHPATPSELDAGRERQQEFERAEKERERGVEKAEKARLHSKKVAREGAEKRADKRAAVADQAREAQA